MIAIDSSRAAAMRSGARWSVTIQTLEFISAIAVVPSAAAPALVRWRMSRTGWLAATIPSTRRVWPPPPIPITRRSPPLSSASATRTAPGGGGPPPADPNPGASPAALECLRHPHDGAAHPPLEHQGAERGHRQHRDALVRGDVRQHGLTVDDHRQIGEPDHGIPP